jgi:hypothetical protein
MHACRGLCSKDLLHVGSLKLRHRLTSRYMLTVFQMCTFRLDVHDDLVDCITLRHKAFALLVLIVGDLIRLRSANPVSLGLHRLTRQELTSFFHLTELYCSSPFILRLPCCSFPSRIFNSSPIIIILTTTHLPIKTVARRTSQKCRTKLKLLLTTMTTADLTPHPPPQAEKTLLLPPPISM